MDQIVVGISSDQTRQKLWVEDALDLEKAKKICRAAERAEKQINELQAANASTVSAVNKINKKDDTFLCKRCGKDHGQKMFPAYGKNCAKCDRRGHFEEMCKSNADKGEKQKPKKHKNSHRKSKSKSVKKWMNHPIQMTATRQMIVIRIHRIMRTI